MSGNKRKVGAVWLPFLFFTLLTIGVVLGYLIGSKNGGNAFKLNNNSNNPLNEIITLINQEYVDSVNTDSVYIDAVNGMLNHLDPHSVYIPANELKSVNEDLEGSFQGIGVEYIKINDTVNLVNIIKGGPSEKAGLQIGDKLIKVNNTLVAGVNLPNDSLVQMLRSTNKSTVQLSVIHTGQVQPVAIKVTRGSIPMYSIDAAYMLDKQTAYIKINRFSATTYDEFRKAITLLKKQGMQQLILDLRNNPGGFLDAAVNVVDEILSDDKLIVYTQGRNSPKKEYKATRPGILEKDKVIVLINENSASASEIVAGAIQDWDRGIIMGRESFGKGLVQQQYDLSNGAALRLTTARYFTPTGRCIQRSYAQGKEAYEEAYFHRLTDTTSNRDSILQNGKIYYSEIDHRKLYAGGGIKPDIFTIEENDINNPALQFLLSTQVLNSFPLQYYANNKQTLSSFKNFNDFNNKFEATPQIMNALRKQFVLENAAYTQKVWSNPSAVEYLYKLTKAKIANMLFGKSASVQVLQADDPTINKALSVFYSAEYASILSKK